MCIVHLSSFFYDYNRKSKSIRNYTYTLTNLIIAVRRYFFYRCNVHNNTLGVRNCNTKY